jgi:hypothetical protein
MWLLKFLPNWLFYGMFLAGLLGLLITQFLPQIIPLTYKLAARIACTALFVVGTFMFGAIHDNEAWLERVREMEAKVAAAEQQSKEENVKIETKIVSRVELVKQRGQDIIQYVDREVTKYDETCVIPKEFIFAHNRAAEQPK